jgi:NADP-dependent 3-hydroxy acid dehydrogenase YdfG
MTQKLAGRVALITGASSGIGEATAHKLAEAGATVVLNGRRAERVHALAERIEAAGGKALALPGDVSDTLVAARVIDDVFATFDRLDILVNAAGIIQPGLIEDADVEVWHEVMEVNLFAALNTCRAVIGRMRAQGGGDIINITSPAGRLAAGPFGPYTVSKFALTGMNELLRQQVGESGIRVCTLEPGATSTEVAEGIRNPAYRDGIRAYVTKEGSMVPEDVAKAILFIVSLPPRANVSMMLIRPTSEISIL